MEGSLNCGECILDRQCNNLPSSVYYEYDGERLTVCPKTLVSDKSIFLVDLFRHYRNGHLYKGGGINNQPAWYLKAMLIIEGTMNKNKVNEQKRKDRRTV